MKITRNRPKPATPGASGSFTGTVHATPVFNAESPARSKGAYVTFQPGARTFWHTHPLGQTLIVTFGTGRVQSEGGAIETVVAGDVVWFAPGEKHWHGAAPDAIMTHLAIGETLDGTSVDWLEPVSDEDYGA